MLTYAMGIVGAYFSTLSLTSRGNAIPIYITQH